MKSLIQNDSYWYMEGEGDDAMMRALCATCAQKQQKGWLWQAVLGYGDYDLFCHSCKNAIHIREKNEIKADSESK